MYRVRAYDRYSWCVDGIYELQWESERQYDRLYDALVESQAQQMDNPAAALLNYWNIEESADGKSWTPVDPNEQLAEDVQAEDVYDRLIKLGWTKQDAEKALC